MKCSNQKGFTLVEVTAVIVIIGVLASVTIRRFDILSDSANSRALVAGITELNVRESLTWTNVKLSDGGWQEDQQVWDALDKNLDSFTWGAGDSPDRTGGTLEFNSNSITLTRIASTTKNAALWQQ